MKQFAVWAGLLVILYGALAAGSQLSGALNPQNILIAIDVSASLDASKYRLPQALAFLKEKAFTKFGIITNSPSRELRTITKIKPLQSSEYKFGWIPVEKLDNYLAAVMNIKMYTTFDLNKLLEFEFDEINSADEIIFVTNARDVSVLKKIPRSRIVEVK
jgi:hypothetical protein